MDLVSSIRKSGSRGGVNFSWDEVAGSQHRENYLGHSLKAPVGRWQKGRDLSWYAKADASGAQSDETEEERAARERREEIKKIKEAEEDALAKALGLPPPQRNQSGANAIEVGKTRSGLAEIKEEDPGFLSAKGADQKAGSKRLRRHENSERRHRRSHRSRSRSRDRRRDRSPRRRDDYDSHKSREDGHSHRQRRDFSPEIRSSRSPRRSNGVDSRRPRDDQGEDKRQKDYSENRDLDGHRRSHRRDRSPRKSNDGKIYRPRSRDRRRSGSPSGR